MSTCENCGKDADRTVRGHSVCKSHARWAESQPKKEQVKAKPSKPRKLDSGEAWTEWYAKHPEAE